MLSPPIQESFIGMDIKTLLWQRSFRKRIGDVCTKGNEVLNGRCSIEYPRNCLVHTVGVGVIKDMDLAATGGTITGTVSLLEFVQFLDYVGPHKVEDCSCRSDCDWSPKQTLVFVLIKHGVFRLLPFTPLWSLDQFAACETHCT
jgi:hypothetical protein